MSKRFIPGSTLLAHGLRILFEDRDLIVVNKPAGLLTIGTATDKMRTAHFVLSDYVRKGSARSRKRVFVVHRLDRETSGVLVFAKSEEAKQRLQAQWPETDKKYLAVVHGTCVKQAETLRSYLAENRAHVVYVTRDTTEGKLAVTAYRVLKQAAHVALLEVTLLTGRKHQIRVQLASIGYPVVGDKKYGQQRDPTRELALHARSLSFPHPFRNERLTFLAEVPRHFAKLVGKLPEEGGAV